MYTESKCICKWTRCNTICTLRVLKCENDVEKKNTVFVLIKMKRRRKYVVNFSLAVYFSSANYNLTLTWRRAGNKKRNKLAADDNRIATL